MAKGSNNVRNKKPHSAKPYDTPKSFVKKVTSHVTSLIQPTWLSKWFSSANEEDEKQNEEIEESPVNEDVTEAPPPVKNSKIALNRTFPANNFHVFPSTSSSNIAGPIHERRYPIVQDDAVPGPSGLQRFSSPASKTIFSDANIQESQISKSKRPRLSVSETTTTVINPIELETKMNGDNQSISSDSTCGSSAVLPQNCSEGVLTLRLKQNTTLNRSSLANHLDNSRDSSFVSSPQNRSGASHFLATPGRRRSLFNVSAVHSPLSPNRSFTRDSLVSSPFYPGKTTYGGASAYRRSREFSPIEVSRRSSIQVKPVNSPSTKDSPSVTTMSRTAQRILAVLEQYSTPLSDAKRMHVGISPTPQVAPTPPAAIRRPLNVPSAPEMLKLKRRELQDSIEAARLIADSSSSAPQYTVGSDDNLNLKSGGKVTKSKPIDDEVLQPVNLPNIPLPISSLPKFDFSVPASKTTAKKDLGNKSDSFVSNIFRNDSDTSHVFKVPVPPPAVNKPNKSVLRVTKPEVSQTDSPKSKKVTFDFQSTTSINLVKSDKCTFRPPVLVQPRKPLKGRHKNVTDSVISFRRPLNIDSDSQDTKSLAPFVNFIAQNPSIESKTFVPKLKETRSNVTEIKPAAELKTGSVMDILGKKSEVASGEVSSSNVSLADVFKPAADSWECVTCLIRNKPSATRCIACETVRESVPVSATREAECSTKPPMKTVNSLNITAPGDTWECSVCLIRNSNSLNKCPACTSDKPTTTNAKAPELPKISNMFKKSSDDWECSTCLVTNKSSSSKCVACEEPKPGSSEKPVISSSIKFNVDIPAEAATFKFGIDKAAEPTPAATAKPEFKFGTSSPTFKFGSSNATEKPTFTFGIPPKDNGFTSTSGFSFGMKTDAPGREAASSSTSSTIANEPKPAEVAVSKRKMSEEADSSSDLQGGVDPNKGKPSSLVNKLETKIETNVGKPLFNFGTPTVSMPNKLPTVPDVTSTQLLSGNIPTSSENVRNMFNLPGKSLDKPFQFSSSSNKEFDAKPEVKTDSSVKKQTEIASSSKTASSSPKYSFGSTSGKVGNNNVPTTNSLGMPTTITTSSTMFNASSCAAPMFSTPNPFVTPTSLTSFGVPVTKSDSSTSMLDATSSVGPATSGITSFKPAFGSIPAFGSTPVSSTNSSSDPTATTFTAPSFSATSTKLGQIVGPCDKVIPPFGLPPSSSSGPAFSVPSATLSFSAPSTTLSFCVPTTTTPAFGTATTNSFGGQASTIQSSFGSQAPAAFGSTTPGSSFGVPSSSVPAFGSAPTAASSSFGSAPTAASSSFGSAPTAASSSFGTQPAGGAFGTSTASKPAFGAATSTTTFTATTTSESAFGTNSGSSFGSSNSTLPAFAAPTSSGLAFNISKPSVPNFGTPTTVPAFGVPATTKPTFGTPTTTAAPSFSSGFGATSSFPTPSFGAPTTQQQAPMFNFGAPTTTTPSFGTSGTTPAFGSSTAPSFGTSTFGPTTTTEKPNSGPFVFGGSATPSFSFGTNQPAASDTLAKNQFNFGSNSTENKAPTAAPAFGGFNFGSTAGNASVLPLESNPFGSTNPQPTNPSAGFGGDNPFFGGGQSSTTAFGFTGNQNTQPQPAGGFNFKAPSSSVTPPSFNPNAAPSFKFSGGEEPCFTASGTPSALAPRRFKKAVRRTQQPR